jgi:regulator of protease activity HflC (stomatin/prohibitin superfamily)
MIFIDMSYYIITPLILLFLILLFASVKILRQYERAVVFTLGKFTGIKGPGLVLLFPFVQEMVRVDLRVQVIEIPSQDVISHDNVSMKVDAVLYFNVVDPERAIVAVQHYQPATNMLAQTTLRAVLGQHDLDEMLSDRKKLSNDLQAIIDTQTEGWGIKVSNVEIRTVELGENMVRAIAKCSENSRQCARRDAAALSSDAIRDRCRPEFDRRLPDADRPHQAVPRPHANPRCTGASQRQRCRDSKSGKALSHLSKPSHTRTTARSCFCSRRI